MWDSTASASARRHYGIALILGFAIAMFYVAMVAPIAYLYSDPDTSYFLEAARNVLAGNGLVVSAELDKWSSVTEPLSLWPPGYPITIAVGAKLLGVDPMWLAPKIAWLSWALLPAALLFVLRPVLSSRSVHVISVIVMLSPGVIANAWQAMTDVPFLLLTLISFGLFFRGTQAGARPVVLMMSGVFCALAYSYRNVGMASFLAIGGAYSILVVLRLVNFRAALSRLTWWAAGSSLIVIPLLLRNQLVFGDLQPYAMPPSQVGVGKNIRDYAASTLSDILAVRVYLYQAIENNAICLALGFGLVLLVWLARKNLARLWNDLPPAMKERFAVLLAYVAAGASVVIVARTTYQWGEFIGTRHVLQYDWVLFAFGAVLFERWGNLSRGAVAAVVGAVVLIVGLRVHFLSQDIEAHREDFAIASRSADPVALMAISHGYRYHLAVKLVIVQDQPLMRALRDLPADSVLMSNFEDVLRVMTGRIVHPITLAEFCDPPKDQVILSQAGASPTNIAVLLFPTRNLVQSGCWQRLYGSSLERFPLNAASPYLISLSAERIGTNP